MKNNIFWDVTPCSLVEIYKSLGSSTSLLNVVKLLLDYTASHPKRVYSSKLKWVLKKQGLMVWTGFIGSGAWIYE
jgi:hypothetical protein